MYSRLAYGKIGAREAGRDGFGISYIYDLLYLGIDKRVLVQAASSVLFCYMVI